MAFAQAKLGDAGRRNPTESCGVEGEGEVRSCGDPGDIFALTGIDAFRGIVDAPCLVKVIFGERGRACLRGLYECDPVIAIIIVIDFGVRYKGYRSDTTRTFYLGKPSESEVKMYEMLRKVQEDTIKFAAEGKKCGEVYDFCLKSSRY